MSAARRRVRGGVALLCGLVAATAGFTWRMARSSDKGGQLGERDVFSYELAWSWEGATWDEARHAYALQSDRGYKVWISAAYIGTATLELVPCKADAPTNPVKASLDFFLPAKAWANHGYIHDGSLVEAPVVDSAFQKEPIQFGLGRASGRSYCQLHELIVPLDQRGADGFHLDHWSAYVRGVFVAPGSTEEHPFESHVNLRGGALVDLIRQEKPLRPGMVTVRVTRSPVHAFDGVAMERLTSSELAYAFMRGLTKGTRAELAPAR